MTDAFLSHASADIGEAQRVVRALSAAKLSVWFDRSTIRLGFLLTRELQQGIQESRTLILLWSKAAQQSPWVKAELLTAYHRNRFILPCQLDPTPLPAFLRGPVALDLRRKGPAPLRELVRDVREAPEQTNETLPLVRSQNIVVALIARQLQELQRKELASMDRNLRAVNRYHKEGGKILARARRKWPFESDLLNLAGYQIKNEYLGKHWGAIQAGQSPQDRLLDQSRQLFFECLLVNPNDPSALNGLGSILILQHELEAAEFFVTRAIELATRQGQQYPEAEQDLELIRRYWSGH